MEIYPILFEQLGPGLSGLCYANWSYANSKYSRRLMEQCIPFCVVFCFFSVSFFFYCHSYLSEQSISKINKKDTWGKLKRTLTWSYLLTYLQTYTRHDTMIYRLKAIKLKSLNAIFSYLGKLIHKTIKKRIHFSV